MGISTGRGFFILCALVSTATFFPIWMVPRDFWDGVIGAYGVANSDYSGIYSWLIPSNWGGVYVLLRAVGWVEAEAGIPSWALLKIVISLSVVGLAQECRLLCVRIFSWEKEYARLAVPLVIGFPCWYVLYGSTFIYLIFIYFVFLGNRLFHDGAGCFSKISGFILMIVSFQVNSNFVMVFALELIRLVIIKRRSAVQWLKAMVVMASAVGIYAYLRYGSPPTDGYTGYNNLISPFSRAGLLTWLRAVAMSATWIPYLMLPWVAVFIYDRWLNKKSGIVEVHQKTADLSLRNLMCVGLLVLGSLFAYMAVGKGAPLFVIRLPEGWLGSGVHLGQNMSGWIYTTADGWSMRNAFLFSIPATVAILWIARIGGTSNKSREFAVVVVVFANLIFLLSGHGSKQTRVAQEAIVLAALKEAGPPPPGRVDIELDERIGWTSWTYETNYLLWSAFGRAQWAGAMYGRDESARNIVLSEREQAINSRTPRSHSLMDEMHTVACNSKYYLAMPKNINSWSFALDYLGLKSLGAANISKHSEDCGG